MSAEKESQPNLTRTLVVNGPLTQGATGSFALPQPGALAALFPQLEILELLGHGGMGAVYKARQRGLDRMVALKILPPQISAEPTFAERFAREARALARLSHPNIVTVFDLGQSGPLYYFLMEFVDGMNLRQLLQSHRLTPPETLALMPQICEALEYAHGEGLVHRDIKPENILLDGKGRVKVADFGLSKLLRPEPHDPQLTQSGQVLGTLHYMAPEQIERPLDVDQRADIYSLGVVLYEMLTGELPLGRFELPSKKAAVDARLDDLVLRAMERDPRRRFPQAGEIRLALEAIAGVASKLSPEVSRKLSYEYRSRAALFGWPLLHVTVGVNPVTGCKRNARGIVALGCNAVGVIAFGNTAVGLIAGGIFGFGLISISVVAVGLLAYGSVAVGLLAALDGIAFGPVAVGGFAVGYYACGQVVAGAHVMSPHSAADPAANAFFSPWIGKTTDLVFRVIPFCAVLFLAIGFLPQSMAKLAERRRSRRFNADRSGTV